MCSLPLPFDIGALTAVAAIVFGIIKNKLGDDREAHLAQYMLGGDLIVASLAVCLAEIAGSLFLALCHPSPAATPMDHFFLLSGIVMAILVLLMLVLNHERLAKKGSKVALSRVVNSNFWGVIATLVSVGFTTHLTQGGGVI